MYGPLNVRNRTCNGGEEVHVDKNVSTSITAEMLELCLENPLICLGSDVTLFIDLMSLSAQKTQTC